MLLTIIVDLRRNYFILPATQTLFITCKVLPKDVFFTKLTKFYFYVALFFNICSKVNRKLRTLADTHTENNEFLNKLANQTEDFAVQLIDQVNAKEELVIRDLPEHVDRYASMLSGMTDAAIIHSQKKVSAVKNTCLNFLR